MVLGLSTSQIRRGNVMHIDTDVKTVIICECYCCESHIVIHLHGNLYKIDNVHVQIWTFILLLVKREKQKKGCTEHRAVALEREKGDGFRHSTLFRITLCLKLVLITKLEIRFRIHQRLEIGL